MSRARDFADLAGSADAGGLGGSNMVINGSFAVSQRGTSETGVTSGGYKQAPDRWIIAGSSAGTWTVSQSSTVPSGEGFSYSYKLDCTTADASLSASDHWVLAHYIEAQNVAHLGYGTSSAKKITLSFWVRSSKTGTYVLEIVRNDSDRHIAQTYTISSADTWERKTLTFDGDTGGSAIPHDNGRGFEINFWLAAGSSFSSGTLATSWAAKTTANRAAGVLNLADSTSNDWYVTGVQLEVGSTATDFDHSESYGETLAKCQRYFFAQQALAGEDYYAFGMGAGETSDTYRGLSSFPVTMRIEPSVTAPASNLFFTHGFTPNTTTVTLDQSGRDCAYVTLKGSGGVSGSAGRWLANNTSAAYLFWSAEL